ncbi:division/outer membrane stress-associated lipid-binding lipoprotein [Pseudidiomarina mangrovi]|uniref:division/outer membrane stress-associated lipid-binding lipoprotein n=1 Tax=Pseudidiomarina mangrovi TaxID=2487133 RepID=UPI000FCBA8EF|nr:division/outer membrane stress-associated lipid-binding lipoprotein [Pseudidiomarina mangrovi]
MKRLSQLALISALVIILSGCVTAMVGATAIGISAATDSRTVGTQVDDSAIEIRVIAALKGEERLDNSRIKVVGFNGAILLIGQVPSAGLKDFAGKLARDSRGVVRVHNEIRVQEVISLTTISNDTWLTSRIKTKLLADDNVEGGKVKVVTENGEVFLMGLIDAQQAAVAVDLARNTNGVSRVIDAFEIQ